MTQPDSPRSSHMTYSPGDHEIETRSGRYIDLANPDPAMIHLDDIAQGLSQTCRYAGQTRRFYSVAEHATLVSAKLRADGQPPAVQMAALHHDDAEAYVADIARPLKSLLQPAYGQISDRLDAAIWEALDLPALGRLGHGQFAWATVKAADDWALACEAHHLMQSRGQGWWSEGLYDPTTRTVEWEDQLGREPGEARRMYLARHDRLLTEMARARLAA